MTFLDDGASATRQARLEGYATVATSLALMSDRRLRDAVEALAVTGSGIGGTSSLLHVGDTPVHVKRVALTDLERQPGNVRSTANVFGLPVWCQYGVGSPGFGVWRELAAHAMTTNWVLAGRSASFPLMYHWRVLDGPASPVPLSPELADVDRAVEYWRGSAAVRGRLQAIASSSATVTLFLEYLPVTLTEWLRSRLAEGDDATDAAIATVERRLRCDVAFMNAAGLFHFDAHFANILTDGHRLRFADFGLATSARFELSAAESRFLSANLTHDACHTLTRLVDWVVTELLGVADPVERDELVRRFADGHDHAGLPPAAAVVVKRHAPVAVVVNEFYRKLHLEDRATPYPADEIQRARAGGGTRQ